LSRIASDHLNAAGAGALGKIAQSLAPGGESVENFIIDQAGPLLRTGHDDAAIVPQRPEAAKHRRADGGAVFLHEERTAASAGQAGFHGAIAAAGLGMANQRELRVLASHFASQIDRVIGRAVIDHDDFELRGEVGQQIEEILYLRRQGRLRIADRQNDAERIVHAKKLRTRGERRAAGKWINRPWCGETASTGGQDCNVLGVTGLAVVSCVPALMAAMPLFVDCCTAIEWESEI
jgi:hypothetical protein